MELKTKLSNLTKSQIQTSLTVSAVLLTALYFSNGGSIAGIVSYVKHPFDKHARQVHMEMGYSNKALASQIKEGHQSLSKIGLKTPTPIKVSFWGPEGQDADEYEILEVVDGEPRQITRRVISNLATKLIIKSNLVGEDGCNDLKISYLQPEDSFSEKESKICLAQVFLSNKVGS